MARPSERLHPRVSHLLCGLLRRHSRRRIRQARTPVQRSILCVKNSRMDQGRNSVSHEPERSKSGLEHQAFRALYRKHPKKRSRQMAEAGINGSKFNYYLISLRAPGHSWKINNCERNKCRKEGIVRQKYPLLWFCVRKLYKP